MRDYKLRFIAERMQETLRRPGARCVVVAEREFAIDLVYQMATPIDRERSAAVADGYATWRVERSVACILPPDAPPERYAGIVSRDVTVILSAPRIHPHARAALRGAMAGTGWGSNALWIEFVERGE